MEIIFLGGFFPDIFIDENQKNSKFQIQNSANTFQWAFIKGIIQNSKKSIKLVTAPFVGWYPKYYNKILIQNKGYSITDNSYELFFVGFLNLPIIKNFFKYFNIKRCLQKLIKQNESYTIIIYSIEIAYLEAAMSIKKDNSNIKICVIITDLFEFPCDSSKAYKLYLKYIEKPMFYKTISKIDAFVILTDKMIEFLKIKHDNWIRIEGLFENSFKDDNKRTLEPDDRRIILYTGTLDIKYGIIQLLDAFNLIKSKAYRLWICGGGPGLDVVKSRISTDSRIEYFGIVPKDKVNELQLKSTVLINPRSPDGVYNNYSFPSKTMEYFASGTPAIIYELEGIPKEYYNYCYTIKGTSIQSMAETIEKVCELDPETLNEKGKAAKKFIFENKTALIQCKKVLNMLENIL